MLEDAQLWKNFVLEICGMTCMQIVSSGANQASIKNLPAFYGEIFDVAAELLHPKDHILLNIKNEQLSFNENLRIDNKTLKLKELENKKVNDILDRDNNFMDALTVSQLFNISLMAANSILSCVPRNWKKRIKEQTSLNVDDSQYFYLLKGKLPIQKITCRSLYWFFIDKISETPSAVLKWRNIYGDFITDSFWKSCCINVHRMSFNQYYQMVQFKIQHRLLNVKYYLNKCGIESTDSCDFCNEIETIDHVFLHCPFNEYFLNKCKNWLDKMTKTNFPMNECQVLFMIENDGENDILNLYNRVFFFARIFIWTCRSDNSKPNLINFLNFLYNEIFYELCTLRAKGQDAEEVMRGRWSIIVDESGILSRELV